jgi:hypothetical protein
LFPVFVDIDADGDIDFITGSSTGRLTFYENTGSAGNFVFKFITAFWKNLEIIGGAELHGASSITFDDIDGDNDRDLFWGDLFNQSLYFIRNTGTAQNFLFNVIDSTYPIPNAWLSGGFNMPRIHDIDNDGKKDLFIGVLIGSASRNNFIYYRNTGTVAAPQFKLRKLCKPLMWAQAVSRALPISIMIMTLPFYCEDKPFVSFFRNTESYKSAV